MSRVLARTLAVALLAAAGCGDGPKTKVSGTVSYNGKPVADGYIVFRSADGKGGEAGGPVLDGKYSLSAVPVGKKTVVVSAGAPPAAGRVMSSEEASKARIDPKAKPAAEVIDPAAKGNGVTVDVQGAEQTLDFALKSQ